MPPSPPASTAPAAPLPAVAAAPRTGDELARALAALHAESAAYWVAYPTPRFFAPLGTAAAPAWSPADHVRHLTTSMRAVTRGLRLPRLLVWVRFGPARRPSRGYDAVRDDYRAALARGGRAGRFAPRPLEVPADAAAAEALRARVTAAHAAALRDLTAATAAWSEAWLDRARFPHPLLGRLTVREMLYFTLYHNLHHVHGAARRAAESAAAGPTAA